MFGPSALILLVSLSAISAAVIGTVGRRTVGDVHSCFQAKQKTCRQQCSEWLPENVTESENCLHNLHKQKMLTFKQCLSDAGMTDSLPCVAFNRSRHECKEEATNNATEAKRSSSSESKEGDKKSSSEQSSSEQSSEELMQVDEQTQKREEKIQAVFESMEGFHDCLFTCMEKIRDDCTSDCTAADETSHKAFETCKRHHGKGRHHGGGGRQHHGGKRHCHHHHGGRHHGGGRHHHHHHHHHEDGEFLMCFN